MTVTQDSYPASSTPEKSNMYDRIETYIIVRNWQPGQSFRLVILRPGRWKPNTPLPADTFSIIVQPVESELVSRIPYLVSTAEES